MDYYYDPEVAAQVAAYVNYVCPVAGSPGGDGEDRPRARQEPVHLPDGVRSWPRTSKVFRALSAAEEAKYGAIWAEGGGQLMARRGPDLRGATGDLTLQAVTKEFGSFTAVDELDLVVPRGGFFALLGPSGCGKTTTLRMVAGLEQPTSGRVLIGDTDLTGSRPYERPVNTVFQSYALFPHLDIAGNVAFGPRRRGRQGRRGPGRRGARAGADGSPGRPQAGPAVRWPAAACRRWPGRWSTGPEVLLLDEPLGALDLKLRRQMQVELKRIQTEVGLTFIHVTHDQEEAMTMADTVAVMNPGGSSRWGRRPSSTTCRVRRSSRTSWASPTSCAGRSASDDGARRDGRDAGRPGGRCPRPGRPLARVTWLSGVRPEKVRLEQASDAPNRQRRQHGRARHRRRRLVQRGQPPSTSWTCRAAARGRSSRRTSASTRWRARGDSGAADVEPLPRVRRSPATRSAVTARRRPRRAVEVLRREVRAGSRPTSCSSRASRG